MPKLSKLADMIKEAAIKIAAVPGASTVHGVMMMLKKRLAERTAKGLRPTANMVNLYRKAEQHIAAGGKRTDVLGVAGAKPALKPPAPKPASFLPKGIVKKPPTVPAKGPSALQRAAKDNQEAIKKKTQATSGTGKTIDGIRVPK